MIKKLFQSAELKKANSELKEINDLEESMKKLSDEQLKNKTIEFKERLANQKSLESIRVEAFAVAREATKRVLKKRPFDVQILGGLILEYGSVAEMKTGEGKTITSIAPVYLNSLLGKGVIVSTVNEYLTQRDAGEMGQVYKWLGLSVGVNLASLNVEQKRQAYACDVTYSVHSEIGFDYLKDNMVKHVEEKVQRGFNFALIDEVDSILIDEARTPLIISGQGTEPSQLYIRANQFVKTLSKDDYDLDWESKGIQLNEKGTNKANSFFSIANIFEVQHSDLNAKLQNALRANYIMFRDADYIVKDNKIIIVDAFTGRIMEGRSYSDGLHQAIQAKEGVEIEKETKTLSTITYQNLFRMFKKLCGMSGTAKTEENEFIEIYNMRVHEIPTNMPIARIDRDDFVFVTAEAKYKAIIEEVRNRHAKGQPILIGTEEVSESEALSKRLTRNHFKHTVLNAKQNEQEAEIIAQASEKGAITIATNMAGRGTDIMPSAESLAVGGLYVIGTSKSEARRIDNQLRGRSGRQGDVGESRFFISLDDKLLSRFSNQQKLKKAFKSFGDRPIKGKTIVKAINRAQIKIEGMNFDLRKNVLQYDDVIRQQRDLIFAQRDLIISQEDLFNVIERMMHSVADDIINKHKTFIKQDGSFDIVKLVNVLNRVWFQLVKYKFTVRDFQGLIAREINVKIAKELVETYKHMRDLVLENVDESQLHNAERFIILDTFDKNWQEHIDQMSKLRSSTSLASYAQKNPYQIYVERGAELFKALLERISHNTIRRLTNNRQIIQRINQNNNILKSNIERIMSDQQNQKKED